MEECIKGSRSVSSKGSWVLADGQHACNEICGQHACNATQAQEEAYQVAVASEAVALTQLLKAPAWQVMRPLADGRLEGHHLCITHPQPTLAAAAYNAPTN